MDLLLSPWFTRSAYFEFVLVQPIRRRCGTLTDLDEVITRAQYLRAVAPLEGHHHRSPDTVAAARLIRLPADVENAREITAIVADRNAAVVEELDERPVIRANRRGDSSTTFRIERDLEITALLPCGRARYS
ncbi:hypothetical protein ACRS5S_11360 [Nocardia asiatica]|uniref:hypothetical protein n=1 Tax=Nocardia asiatica TaxID=209252 RepID=UPI003EE13BD5